MNVLNTFPDSKAVIFPNTVEEETVLSWQQLPTKVWFRIIAQKDIHKKNGEDVKILDLLREGGAICRVWTTAIIACKIEEQRVQAPNNFPAHLYTLLPLIFGPFNFRSHYFSVPLIFVHPPSIRTL